MSGDDASVALKCLGVLIIIAACVYICREYSSALTHTVSLACDAVGFMTYAEGAVRTRRDPCERIISSYTPDYGGAAPFWKYAANHSLALALKSEYAASFDDATREQLEAYASSSGRGYEEDELMLIESVKSKLQANADELEARSDGDKKTFYAVVSFLGVCLIILTI